jgi:hypothetical protein
VFRILVRPLEIKDRRESIFCFIYGGLRVFRTQNLFIVFIIRDYMYCEILNLRDNCELLEDKRIFDYYLFNAETRTYNFSHQSEEECPVF